MTGFWDSSHIKWTICKQSAPRSRQMINIITSTSLNVYRPEAVPDAQSTVSKHGRQPNCNVNLNLNCHLTVITATITLNSNPHSNPKPNKKLSYRRGTARCVVSVEILPTATQQCRNYLYDNNNNNNNHLTASFPGQPG